MYVRGLQRWHGGPLRFQGFFPIAWMQALLRETQSLSKLPCKTGDHMGQGCGLGFLSVVISSWGNDQSAVMDVANNLQYASYTGP